MRSPSRVTAVDQVTAELRRAILRGELAAGHKLPPERTLCLELGISRLTLRAALTRLTGSGLLSVRHGSGYAVADLGRQGGPDLLAELAAVAAERGQLEAVARDLLAMRAALAELLLARLLAAAPVAAAGFDAAVAELSRQIDRGATVETIAGSDLEVARALAEASGSLALAVALNPIAAALDALPALRDAIYARPADNLAGYRLLAAALAGPAPADPAAAAARLAAELRRLDDAALARLAEAAR